MSLRVRSRGRLPSPPRSRPQLSWRSDRNLAISFGGCAFAYPHRPQRVIHGRHEAAHVAGADGADATHAEARSRGVVEVADQEAARLQGIDEARQGPGRIARGVDV